MPQAKTTTTLVRRAVARFESTCATPTLASRAVAAAKAAESSAHPIQVMRNHGTRYAYSAGADLASSKLESMETGKASKTALRVAIRRAAHQLMDIPAVLDDPIAVRLVGPGYARDMERAMHQVARDFRAFMAARSRYAEDRLAEAVAKGVTQYVDSRRGAGYVRLSQSISFAAGLRGGFSRDAGVEAGDARRGRHRRA